MDTTESCSGLDRILKNTEFENSQQLKDIDTEREKIQDYEQRIEKCHAEIRRLEEHSAIHEEQTRKFSKQYFINKENIDNLKQTSIVLTEHEEALKKKLQCKLEEVDYESTKQNEALAKYESVWARYEVVYNSMEEIQELKQKKMVLHTLTKQNEEMKSRINELETELGALRARNGNVSLVSWVLKIATLRVETNGNIATLEANKLHALSLREKIKKLQEAKIQKSHQEETSVIPGSKVVESMRSGIEDGQADVSVAWSSNEPQERAKIPSIQKPKQLSIANTPTLLHTQNYISSEVTTTRRKGITGPSKAPRYHLEMPQLSFPSQKKNGNDSSHSSRCISSPSTPAKSISTSCSNLSSLNSVKSSSPTQVTVSAKSPSPETHFPKPRSSTLAPSPLVKQQLKPNAQPKIPSPPQHTFAKDSNNELNFPFKVPKGPVNLTHQSVTSSTNDTATAQIETNCVNEELPNSSVNYATERTKWSNVAVHEAPEYFGQDKSAYDIPFSLSSNVSSDRHMYQNMPPAVSSSCAQQVVPGPGFLMQDATLQQQSSTTDMDSTFMSDHVNQNADFSNSQFNTGGGAFSFGGFGQQSGGHSGGFGGFDFFGQQDNGGSTFSSGFSFGGSSPSQQSVKQDGGSSTFSGGFLFGGNPPQQDAGGMKQDGGNSTFSSGFSFGGNSPSQQDTGGFNMNFGNTDSANLARSFSMF